MDALVALFHTHVAAVVFLATLAARLGAPVPAVPFLVAAGGMAMGDTLALSSALAAAVAGNLIGDAAWFYAGRRWGYRVMRLLCRISLSADACVQRSEAIIGRWGGASLLLAKFVPGVSLVAPPMAGALHMTTRRFLFYELLSAAVWSVVFLLVGVVFHSAIADVMAVLGRLGLVAGALLALVLGGLLAWRFHQRRAGQRAPDVARIEVDALLLALAGSHPVPLLLDVRNDRARLLEPIAIAGAIGVPFADLSARAAQWQDEARGGLTVLFCDCPADASAVAGARVLQRAGLARVRVLAGGLAAWRAAQAVALEERPVDEAASAAGPVGAGGIDSAARGPLPATEPASSAASAPDPAGSDAHMCASGAH